MVSPTQKQLAKLHLTKETIERLINYPGCSIEGSPNTSDWQIRITMTKSLRNVESYVALKKALEELGIVFEEGKFDETPCLVIKTLKNSTVLEREGFQAALENYYLANRRKQEEAIKASISVNYASPSPLKINAIPKKVPLVANHKLQHYRTFFAEMMVDGNKAVTIEKEEVRIEYPDNFEKSAIHVSALERTLINCAIPHQMKSHGVFSKFVAVIPTLEMNTLMKDPSLVVKFVNEYKKQVRNATREYNGMPMLQGFPQYSAQHPYIQNALREMENVTNMLPGSILDNHAFYFSLFAEKMEELDKSDKSFQEKTNELFKILTELKELSLPDAQSARKLGEKLLTTFSQESEKALRVRKLPPTPLPSPLNSPSISPLPSPRNMSSQTASQGKGANLKAYGQLQEELAKKLQKRQDPKEKDEGMSRSPRKKG